MSALAKRRIVRAPAPRFGHQCDECHTACYSTPRQEETARLEFEAIRTGTKYVCDDFKPHWLRVLNES